MEAGSVMRKVVLGVQIAAFGGQLVGLASPYWMDAGQGLHMGLWQFCGPIYPGGTTPDWFRAVQGLQVIGFCLSLTAAILTGVYMYKAQSEQNNMICFIDMLICFITALAVIVSIGLFGAEIAANLPAIFKKKSLSKLSWAFGLSASSSGLSIVSGILLAILLSKNRT